MITSDSRRPFGVFFFPNTGRAWGILLSALTAQLYSTWEWLLLCLVFYQDLIIETQKRMFSETINGSRLHFCYSEEMVTACLLVWLLLSFIGLTAQLSLLFWHKSAISQWFSVILHAIGCKLSYALKHFCIHVETNLSECFAKSQHPFLTLVTKRKCIVRPAATPHPSICTVSLPSRWPVSNSRANVGASRGKVSIEKVYCLTLTLGLQFP